MAEETRNTEQAGTQEQTAQPQAQPQQPVNEDVSSAMTALKGLVEMPEINTPAEPQVTEQPEETASAELGEVGETGEQPPESAESTEDKGQEGLKIESPIFGEKGLSLREEQENSEDKRIPENAEEIQSFLKEQFGYEDLNSFKTEFDSMKENQARFNEMQNQNEQLSSIFREMPPELYDMVDTFVRGEDWKPLAKQVKNIDFMKEADAQNVEHLLDQYASEKVTAEDWEEYNDPDGDPTVKRFVNAQIENAKIKFDQERKEVTSYRDKMALQAQESQKIFAESVNKTVSNLSSQIEGIDESYVKKVSEELRQNDFNSLFYKEDGSLREDAAVAYVMAKDGLELVTRLQRAARVNAKNEERQEVLSRGADKPTVRRTRSEGTEVRPEIKKILEGIEAIGNNKNTY